MHNNDTVVSISSHSSLVVSVIFIITLKLNPPSVPARADLSGATVEKVYLAEDRSQSGIYR